MIVRGTLRPGMECVYSPGIWYCARKPCCSTRPAPGLMMPVAFHGCGPCPSYKSNMLPCPALPWYLILCLQALLQYKSDMVPWHERHPELFHRSNWNVGPRRGLMPLLESYDNGTGADRRGGGQPGWVAGWVGWLLLAYAPAGVVRQWHRWAGRGGSLDGPAGCCWLMPLLESYDNGTGAQWAQPVWLVGRLAGWLRRDECAHAAAGSEMTVPQQLGPPRTPDPPTLLALPA